MKFFLVESSPKGGFIARAVGADIFTEADDMMSPYTNTREEVIAA